MNVMTCKECGFAVDNKMRFALMKNECPACGEQLFSPEDMNHISMIQGKVLLESFSDKFNEAESYDISLFIFNEIKYGLGLVISPRPEQGEPSEAVDTAAVQSSPPPFDPDEIRKEIEQEIPEVASLPDISIDETASEKAQRLKEVAARSPFGRRPGASVKRVT